MKPFLSSSFSRPAGFCQQPRRFSHNLMETSSVTGGRWVQVNCPPFFKTDWFGESRLSGKKARSSFVAACRSESVVQLSSSGAVLFFLIHPPSPPKKRGDLDTSRVGPVKGWGEWVVVLSTVSYRYYRNVDQFATMRAFWTLHLFHHVISNARMLLCTF